MSVCLAHTNIICFMYLKHCFLKLRQYYLSKSMYPMFMLPPSLFQTLFCVYHPFENQMQRLSYQFGFQDCGNYKKKSLIKCVILISKMCKKTLKSFQPSFHIHNMAFQHFYQQSIWIKIQHKYCKHMSYKRVLNIFIVIYA